MRQTKGRRLLGKASARIGVVVVVVAVGTVVLAQLGHGSTEPSKKYDPPPPSPEQSPPTGILTDFNDPFSHSDLAMTNVWQGYDSQKAFVQVWAGSARDDPKQGEIVVMRVGAEGGEPQGTVYPTPSANGSVRITQADGLRLTLSCDDGTAFVFDVDTLKYE